MCLSKIKTNSILYRQAAKDTSNVCNVSLPVNVTWYHRFSIWARHSKKKKKKSLKSNKGGNKIECIKNIKHWTLKVMSASHFNEKFFVFVFRAKTPKTSFKHSLQVLGEQIPTSLGGKRVGSLLKVRKSRSKLKTQDSVLVQWSHSLLSGAALQFLLSFHF